jgi:RNA polymerase sigma-70 factor (ECF subfamily)
MRSSSVPASWPRLDTGVTTLRQTLPDGELVQRCRAGDGEAWNVLVERHSRYVHGLLLHGFRLEGHAAEDVFQEVFTRVYLRLDSVRDADAIRSWIGQVTRRAALDWLRKNRREVLVDEPLEEQAYDDPLAVVEDAMLVRDALGRLPEHQQEILDRFFSRDESYRTIGLALDLPHGTIASRISRALAALRRELEDHGRSPDPETSL